eukprot:UN11386
MVRTKFHWFYQNSLCKYSAWLTSSMSIDLSYFDRSQKVRKVRHGGHLSFKGTFIFNPKTSERRCEGYCDRVISRRSQSACLSTFLFAFFVIIY